MRLFDRMIKRTEAIVWVTICFLAALTVRPARAQTASAQYSRLAPVGKYLMERTAEISLARSAAPSAISRNASVLVLTRRGYETAVKGTNGFVCMVERSWLGPFDSPEFWDPKIRGANCLNAEAARSVLPLSERRTEMVLAGRSLPEIINAIKTALARRELPSLARGAMGYMMSKNSYLTEQRGHNLSHVMVYVPLNDAAAWGAGLPGSPIGSGGYWFSSKRTAQEFDGLPPLRIFIVAVSKWSDGTATQSM